MMPSTPYSMASSASWSGECQPGVRAAMHGANLDGQNALDDERAIPIVAENLELVPRMERAGVCLAHPRDGSIDGARGRLIAGLEELLGLLRVVRERRDIKDRRLVERRHEYGVREADLRADTVQEREVRRLASAEQSSSEQRDSCLDST